MTSKTSFPERWHEFCQTYFWALKKNIGMLSLLAVLMFVAMPMVLLITVPRWISDYSQAHSELHISQSSYLSGNCHNFMHTLVPFAITTLVLLFGLILCISLFGYMQKKRSVDLFHALPVGRAPMLLGRWCAGITVLFVPVIVNYLIAAIICAVYGITPEEPLVLSVLRIILMGTAAFTFAMLMAVCSGTTFDTVVSIVGVNAGYPLLIFLGGMITEMVLPGTHFDMGGSLHAYAMTALAPYASAYAAFLSPMASAWWFYAWWIAVTAGLLLASVWLYHQRRSESAEDNFAFPIPKTIIRFLLTAAGGLAFGLLLNRAGNAGFFIGVAVGSVIVHVIVEALYSRGFQRIWKSFAWYGAFAAAFLIFYGTISTGFFGYDTRVPNAADVQSVIIQKPGYEYSEIMPGSELIFDENGKEIKHISPVIRQPENIQQVIRAQSDIIGLYRAEGYPYSIKDAVSAPITFSYQMKNGSVLTRQYRYYDSRDRNFQSSYMKKSRGIFQIPEYLEGSDLIFYVDPEDIGSVVLYSSDGKPKNSNQKTLSLTQNRMQELLAALRKDYLHGKINQCDKDCKSSICLQFKRALTPQNRLKDLLGGYSGKVELNSGEYRVADEDCESYRLIQELSKE